MGIIFKNLFDCVKRKKGYFTFLVILSVVCVVLGVIAGIKLKGETFTIDLSHIAYIKFLGGHCGFVSMIFGLLLSLLVFYGVILLCNCKKIFVPLGVLFYMYLVYSQAVIFMSIISIYGILNCIILAIILLIFTILVWILFMFAMCEFVCHTSKFFYFKNCFSLRESRALVFLIMLIVLIVVFSLLLLVLKNYVLLLIFS